MDSTGSSDKVDAYGWTAREYVLVGGFIPLHLCVCAKYVVGVTTQTASHTVLCIHFLVFLNV